MAVPHMPSAPRQSFNWLSASFAGIWLVFMIFPVGAIWTYQQSPWMRGYGLTSVALFAVIYFCAFGKPSWLPGGSIINTALWNLLLFLPFIGVLFTARSIAFSLVTYLVALWIFLPDYWYGLRVALVIVIVMFAASYLLFPQENALSRPWMFIGSLFVILVGYLGKRDEDKQSILFRAQQAEEREAIAADVHDLLGHSLTVISLKAELAQKIMEDDPAQAKEELSQISSLSRSALAQVRSTVTRLRLPDLQAELSAAAIALKAAGIEANLPSTSHIARTVSTNSSLFAAVVRESITNVIRHSGARICTIRIEPERIEIMDDGVGYPSAFTMHPSSLPHSSSPSHPPVPPQDHSHTHASRQASTPPSPAGQHAITGNGIAGMRHRVEKSGGILLIERCSNEGGTRVLVSMNGDTSRMG